MTSCEQHHFAISEVAADWNSRYGKLDLRCSMQTYQYYYLVNRTAVSLHPTADTRYGGLLIICHLDGGGLIGLKHCTLRLY